MKNAPHYRMTAWISAAAGHLVKHTDCIETRQLWRIWRAIRFRLNRVSKSVNALAEKPGQHEFAEQTSILKQYFESEALVGLSAVLIALNTGERYSNFIRQLVGEELKLHTRVLKCLLSIADRDLATADMLNSERHCGELMTDMALGHIMLPPELKPFLANPERASMYKFEDILSWLTDDDDLGESNFDFEIYVQTLSSMEQDPESSPLWQPIAGATLEAFPSSAFNASGLLQPIPCLDQRAIRAESAIK